MEVRGREARKCGGRERGRGREGRKGMAIARRQGDKSKGVERASGYGDEGKLRVENERRGGKRKGES